MAAVSPPDMLEGYALLAAAAAAPSAGIFIPLASMPDLSPAEANAATGDGRKVVLALVREVSDRINALAPTARPTKLTITKGTPQGISGSSVRVPYTINFDLEVDAADVAPE